MAREIICIQCPQGCRLQVSSRGQDLVVQGNRCPRGVAYAEKELTNPSRTLTTTVRTSFSDYPMLPVRTQGEVPLARIFACMGEINSVRVERRLRPGDVVIPRLAGTDVSLIATADMGEEQSAYH
ncbi:MAG: DUF1667 domain-containing protein [Bacillota bacterium]|jgi:CxxC motif-containing protein